MGRLKKLILIPLLMILAGCVMPYEDVLKSEAWCIQKGMKPDRNIFNGVVVDVRCIDDKGHIFNVGK